MKRVYKTYCNFAAPPSSFPSDHKKTACYDIDVETDDTLKTQMNNFLLSTTSQQVGYPNLCIRRKPLIVRFCQYKFILHLHLLCFPLPSSGNRCPWHQDPWNGWNDQPAKKSEGIHAGVFLRPSRIYSEMDRVSRERSQACHRRCRLGLEWAEWGRDKYLELCNDTTDICFWEQTGYGFLKIPHDLMIHFHHASIMHPSCIRQSRGRASVGLLLQGLDPGSHLSILLRQGPAKTPRVGKHPQWKIGLSFGSEQQIIVVNIPGGRGWKKIRLFNAALKPTFHVHS